jgi:hypothetical protein
MAEKEMRQVGIHRDLMEMAVAVHDCVEILRALPTKEREKMEEDCRALTEKFGHVANRKPPLKQIVVLLAMANLMLGITRPAFDDGEMEAAAHAAAINGRGYDACTAKRRQPALIAEPKPRAARRTKAAQAGK